MKTYLYLLPIFISIAVCGKSQECNYIESGYYETNIAYMLGNKDVDL